MFSSRPHQNNIAIAANPNIWVCWIPTCINVHGTVKKALPTGGTAPICVGVAQIFEVDLDCTLDSFTFFDLNWLKLKLIEKLSVQALTQQPVSFRSVSNRVVQRMGSNVRANTARQAAAMASSQPASGLVRSAAWFQEVATTLAALQGSALKNYMVANKAILQFFLCELIPDSAFCWQELGEATIQSDGTFNAEVCFWCPDDLPDLYFEVVQNINGTDTEISDPQIACSTYYDYDGSQSVDITVTDPRAIACNPGGPDLGFSYVWPTAIGNVDLGQIDGLETGLGTGLLPGNTPWGGTLDLQMRFSPDLATNGLQYYRWSYKFDDESIFTPISTPVSHRYMTTVVMPGPVIFIHLTNVSLGPNTVNGVTNLFEIPDPSLPWVDIDDPADRPFAYFDSTENVVPRERYVHLDAGDVRQQWEICALQQHAGLVDARRPGR